MEGLSAMRGTAPRRSNQLGFDSLASGKTYTISGEYLDITFKVIRSGIAPMVEAIGDMSEISPELAGSSSVMLQLIGWIPVDRLGMEYGGERLFFTDNSRPHGRRSPMRLIAVINMPDGPAPYTFDVEPAIKAV